MNSRGFSLFETLIAVTIATVALLGLVQLLTVAARSIRDARTMTMTSLLAQDKMEQLRGLAWGFDPAGLPFGDTTTDLTVHPQRPEGGLGLSVSPPEALDQNVAGYCDFLDGQGRLLVGRHTVTPAGTAYVRRWSVGQLPSSPHDTVVLQVVVMPWRGALSGGAGRRLPGEARLISLKTRKTA
jgi:hypothetical protein